MQRFLMMLIILALVVPFGTSEFRSVALEKTNQEASESSVDEFRSAEESGFHSYDMFCDPLCAFSSHPTVQSRLPLFPGSDARPVETPPNDCRPPPTCCA